MLRLMYVCLQLLESGMEYKTCRIATTDTAAVLLLGDKVKYSLQLFANYLPNLP